MIINTVQEFYKFFTKGKPIISIDYGKRKIGIAISDPNHNISMPLCLIDTSSEKKQLQQIIDLIKKHDACTVVMGMPINMDGTQSDQTLAILKFADRLSTHINIPIFMQDERLTSKAADNLLKSLDLKRKQRNQKDDIIAASMILETVLESCKKI
ncbi:Holliday junction resolvase RuvX [Rickettsiaceae bacterium]|nr:Holliday junction resolvase RuvX [Rickettsiaceae bacterium]